MPTPYRHEPGRNLMNQGGAASRANSENSVPGKIKCHVCKKQKPHTEYAKRQLQKHQDNPYAPGGRSNKEPKSTCRNCTPGQTVELTCVICHKTWGLERFAKTQRKHPKRARCLKCVELHLDTEPGLTPPSSDFYSESDSDAEDFDRPNGVKTIQKAPEIKRIMATPAQDDDDASASESEDDDDDDAWESVQKDKKNTPVLKIKESARAVVGYGNSHGSNWGGSSHAPSAAPTVVGKSGWAKVKKVCDAPRRGADPQLHEGEHEEWSSYARDIRTRRDGKAPIEYKKKGAPNDERFDDDDW